MEIPKIFLNRIRGVLRKDLKIIESEYSKLNDLRNFVIKYYDILSIKEKKECIKVITKNRITKLNIISSKKNIINYLDEVKESMEQDKEKMLILMRSLRKNGFQEVTYSFPIFCSIDTLGINYLFQYLFIDGIKYNGSHEKNEKLMDEIELKLYDYEKQMAALINDDLTIDWSNIFEFGKYFSEYMKYFYENTTNRFDVDGGIEYSLNIIFDKMNTYISGNKLFVKIIKEHFKEEQSKTMVLNTSSISIKEDNIEESILQNQEELKNETARKVSEKQNLLNSLVREDEIKIYNEAKTSENIEATQIIKDIDAILDLLLEIIDDEEKEELTNELNLYFNYLKQVLKLDEIKYEKSKIVYYKYLSEDGLRPYILDDIQNIQKGFYKQIYLSLNKLVMGNIKGREVQGKLPIKVWAAKGLDFRIFYTIINDVVIIIRAFSNDKGFDEIKKVITSHEFLNYYQSIKKQIENNTWNDELDYTNLIRDELCKTSAIKSLKKK